MGEGGQLSSAVCLAPHLQNKNLILDAYSTNFKLSECKDVLIIFIFQVKLSCFLLSHSFIRLAAGVGGNLSRAVLLAPTHLCIKS